MRTAAVLSAFAVVGAASAGAAQAAPSIDRGQLDAGSMVEHVQAWRYHRGCGWRGGRWVVDLGRGRIVVCRPNRPGRDWVWRDEGPRHGWYHPRRKVWHFNAW